MSETEEIELEGKARHPWRQKRNHARANLLWMYMKQHEGKRFTQAELSEALGLSTDGRLLREAIEVLEDRGWLTVDRKRRPHTYTLN